MINDTINPMNFDITKNLHGHVRVETRDRWTGRVVDSQEKDNLVTNALQDLLMARAWTRSNSSAMFTDVLPLHEKALGGLLLFNGTLTASATNTSLPSSVRLVGCAGQTSDTTNAIKGSLNTPESIYTSTGFSTTWDFATSQANGTIASLARTSYRFIASQNILSKASFAQATLANGFDRLRVCYLGYNSTNQHLYFAISENMMISGVAYSTDTIYRVTADFSEISLLGSFLPPASKATAVKVLTSSDGTAMAANYSYDKYDNNFIYGNGETLHIVAMDGTHTTKTATGTSGVVAATENYYWRIAQPNAHVTVYRISKSNPSDIVTVPQFPVGYRSLLPCENDVLVLGGTNGDSTFYIVYPDGTTLAIPDTAGANAADIDNPQFRRIAQFFVSGGNHDDFFYPSFYLGTIANLDSPVTKTSSQTMKITYTLTEA